MEIKHFILKPSFKAIDDILRLKNGEISGIEGVPSVNVLRINPEHMDLEFDSTYHALPLSTFINGLPELSLRTAQAIYLVPQHNAHFEGSIVMGGKETQHFDLRFSQLSQNTIVRERSYYWRFFYPVDGNEWLLKIQARPYSDDYGTHHFYNNIVVSLDDNQMNLFSITVDNRHWMIIETEETMSFEEMNRRVRSLIVALGLVIGKRYGDYCFHVASLESDFSVIEGVEVISLQKTKYCPYQILSVDNNFVAQCLRQYDHQHYALESLESLQEDNAKWYYNGEATVSIDAFDKLSQLCFQSNDMQLAASMLIDGSLLNLEYQKPFFHVALETITSSLLKKEDNSIPPIMPKDLFEQNVAPLLIETLNSIPDLSEDVLRVFSQRIQHNLNNAPNANKLEACFPKYGYTLTTADKDAINKRNSTFHGHLTSDEKPLRDQRDELLAMSLRLHKLCALLLLKEAGFVGKILNNEVLFGMKEACERKEPVLIDV